MTNSHAVTIPNRRVPTKIDAIKVTLASTEQHNQLLALLGTEDEVRRFQASAIDYVRRVPKLLECDKTSLMLALMTAAQFRFLPSSVAGEMYIIPYGSEAKPQIGYQGWVTLLYRGGRVKGITAEIVYANDVFEYEAGLEPKLIHKPKLDGDRGDPIAVYTVAQLEGGARTFKVMTKSEVMTIKNTSKAKGKSDSPWNSGDPLLAMWKKTCLIQHQKYLPKTPDIVKALEVDYDGEGIERPVFDAAGPATAKASHDPAKLENDHAESLNEEQQAQNDRLNQDENVAKCEKHGTALDGDGECGKCIAEALDKPPETKVIEA